MCLCFDSKFQGINIAKPKIGFSFIVHPLGSSEMACTTTSGDDPDKPCIFPFKFRGITHNNCTLIGNEPGKVSAWCSTKVDDSGKHVGGGKGNWGVCEPKCQPNPGKYTY